ncbi:hypothetical protein HK405_005865 [Cladochytrium tenue]|nr:hypothetical protein HK405_005865 [Cladochytrium tenue]
MAATTPAACPVAGVVVSPRAAAIAALKAAATAKRHHPAPSPSPPAPPTPVSFRPLQQPTAVETHQLTSSTTTAAAAVAAPPPLPPTRPDALGALAMLAVLRLLSAPAAHAATFRAYAARLAARSGSSAFHIAAAVTYLARLKRRFPHALKAAVISPSASSHDPGAATTDGLEFRLFAVALLLAHKTAEDASPTARSWCRVSRVRTPRELLAMELEFLGGMDYDVSLPPAELAGNIRALASIVSTVAAHATAAPAGSAAAAAAAALLAPADAKECLRALADLHEYCSPLVA